MTPGTHIVSYEAKHGRALTYLNHTVNITLPYSSAQNLTQTQYRFYSTLEGASDYALYRIVDPPGCSDYFVMRRAKSLDSTDIDMHLAHAEPSSLGNNSVAYSKHRDGPDAFEIYRWDAIQDQGTYAVLITHEGATRTCYYVDLYVSCGGSNEDREVPRPGEITLPIGEPQA